MQRKLRVANTLLSTFLAICSPSLVLSQSNPTPPVGQFASNGGEIQDIISRGRAIEAESRWQDAIQLYESAYKKHLNSDEIKRRLDICRIHHDVVRRYGDNSFTSSIEQMPAATALELYSEVLGKLELNYVEPIRLEELLKKGTAYLEVSLTEPDFLKRNLSNTPADQIESFRSTVHKMVLGRPIRNRTEARNLVSAVASHASKQLGLSPTATIHEYVAGAVGLLDPYSGYMTAGELAEVMSQIEGNLIGLGVELWAEKEELRIVEVFQGSPADFAGLTTGDRILQVGNAVTAEISAKKAADLLRGPEHSQVRLVIARKDLQPQEVVVTRRRVEVPSVASADMVDSDERVGYIRITNFQKTTSQEVDHALMTLNRQGMKSLIIDLRRNPGGLLDSAVEVADRFLRQGAIVTTRGRNGNENRSYVARDPMTWDIPLVVLIDKDSASASEIFAGAIRDHHRGTLVGTTSYGKGSVQGLFHTDTAGGGLRLTVSKFFSPLGHPISLVGVDPDIRVDLASNANSTTAFKPVIGTGSVKGSDGSQLIDFKNREQDLALRRAIQAARESVKVAKPPMATSSLGS